MLKPPPASPISVNRRFAFANVSSIDCVASLLSVSLYCEIMHPRSLNPSVFDGAFFVLKATSSNCVRVPYTLNEHDRKL